MLSILQKVTSKVICIVDKNEYTYNDGKEAYKVFKGRYIINSIYLREDYIVIELSEIIDSKEWREEYKQQFGEEPSFF